MKINTNFTAILKETWTRTRVEQRKRHGKYEEKDEEEVIHVKAKGAIEMDL